MEEPAVQSSWLPSEWRLVTIVVLIVFVVTIIPVVYAALSTPDGMSYTGINYMTPGDMNVFLSMIEAGKTGINVALNLYTSEPQHAIFLNPLWFVIGLGARVFHVSSLVAFHAARLLVDAAFVFVLYGFLRFCFSSVRIRKIALLVTVFASGLGLFFTPFLFDLNAIYEHPVDTWVPESIPFLSLYHSPHLAASLTLIVAIFWLMLKAFRSNKIRYSAGAGIAGLFLTWFHPFNTPTIVAVLSTFVLLSMVLKRKVLWSWIGHTALFGFVMSPAVLYLYLIGKADYVIGRWSAENILPSPSPLMYLIAFVLVLFFALLAVRKLNLRSDDSHRFFVVWIVVASILIYFPVTFQRRMVEGMFIPLAILSAIGILRVWQLLVGQRYGFLKQTCLLVGLIIFFPLTNIQMVGQDLYLFTVSRELPYFITDEQVEALDWIRDHTPTDAIILSSQYMGNFIPAHTLRRVYIGHGPQTINLLKKFEDVYNFYGGHLDNDERTAFLQSRGITYVMVGPKEREYGPDTLGSLPVLSKVFDNGVVALYEVL